MFDAEDFFRTVIWQNADEMRSFFDTDVWVEWPCTNEHFTLEEYIRANCEYPGDWCGGIERCEKTKDGLVMAVRVWPKDKSASFHAISFITLKDNRIAHMVEYWADDGPAPAWRQQMKIGTSIANQL